VQIIDGCSIRNHETVARKGGVFMVERVNLTGAGHFRSNTNGFEAD
jgi:hypothetical protein